MRPEKSAASWKNIEACGFGSVIPSGIRRLIKALNERVENAVDDFEGGKNEGGQFRHFFSRQSRQILSRSLRD